MKKEVKERYIYHLQGENRKLTHQPETMRPNERLRSEKNEVKERQSTRERRESKGESVRAARSETKSERERKRESAMTGQCGRTAGGTGGRKARPRLLPRTS